MNEKEYLREDKKNINPWPNYQSKLNPKFQLSIQMQRSIQHLNFASSDPGSLSLSALNVGYLAMITVEWYGAAYSFLLVLLFFVTS